jgi:hypothetical protein
VIQESRMGRMSGALAPTKHTVHVGETAGREASASNERSRDKAMTACDAPPRNAGLLFPRFNLSESKRQLSPTSA